MQEQEKEKEEEENEVRLWALHKPKDLKAAWRILRVEQ